jgi:MFS superfamily sulfate permease-like transporter
MAQSSSFFAQWRQDLPAGLVVFLVAVPLCLGIALASGVPPFAGLIAGIVGGTIVAVFSGSPLGVSGPAAGLVAIVLAAVESLGYEAFLLAVLLCGVLQMVLGFARAGIIAYYFPSSVIKGMLSGIGLIIILKQVPHALGHDEDYEGDLDFLQHDGENTFSAFLSALQPGSWTTGAVVISLVCLGILILWEQGFMKRIPLFKIIQGPLVAVFAGVLMQLAFAGSSLGLAQEHLVNIPIADSFKGVLDLFTLPDFGSILNEQVWLTAATLALVASMETLLCVEATDKLDPHKRLTPTNRELQAQGIGNMVSGLIGGLPITQVIIRSSANIQSGGQTKLAAIVHGVLLLLSALLIPGILNMVPKASLAAILLLVGYKLAKPALFREQYAHGWTVFIPFVVTIVAILVTDLLIGIGVGMVVAVFFILLRHFRTPFFIHQEHEGNHDVLTITFAEDVSFLHKAGLLTTLKKLPAESRVIIDGRNARRMDADIQIVLEEFMETREERAIEVELLGIDPVTMLPTTSRPAQVPSSAKPAHEAGEMIKP